MGFPCFISHDFYTAFSDYISENLRRGSIECTDIKLPYAATDETFTLKIEQIIFCLRYRREMRFDIIFKNKLI